MSLRRHTAPALSSLLLAAGLLVGLPGTATAEGASVRTAPDGTVVYADPGLADASTQRVTGTLYEVAVETGPERPPVLVTDGGAVVPLDATEPLDASGGQVVAELVDGSALDAALDGRPAAPVEVASARVEQAEAAAAVDHQVYVAVVTNAGSAAPASSSAVESLVDAAMSWWTTEAGAQGSFQRADVATVRYASSLSTTERCGINAGTNALWTEASARFPGVGFGGTSGNHLVVVVDDDGCGGTGIGTLGGSFANGGLVTLTDRSDIFPVTAIHELGHNVSLEHANAPAGEYYDLYSVMGLAASFTFNGQPVLFTPSALESSRRDQLGLDVAGEIEVVDEGQQVSRVLAGRGAAAGLRGLEVRRGGTSYWVDWRSGTARDDGSFYETYTGAGFGSTRYNPGVTITTRPTGGRGETELQTITTDQRYGARTAGQTFTAGDLTITVSSISGSGASVSVQNGSTPLPALPSAVPTISGSPVVGGTLTAGTAGWETGASFTYQWRVAGAPVATTPTFSPRPADVGKTVTVSVTGSKTGFAPATRDSAATAPVSAGTLVPVDPTVSGTPVVDGTLTASTPAWGPGTVALARQWRVGGVDVPGATGTTFTPRAQDVGQTVVLRVTGARDGYATQTRDSAATAPVAAGTLTAPTPTISGTAAVGSTLTVSTGSWGPAPVGLTRQWRVGGVDVAGATGTTFVPRDGDVGKVVTVRVSGTKGGYASTSRESAATSVVTAAPVPARSWRTVSAGALSTCAVDIDRALHCWGENASGRLGDGTTTDRSTPTRVGSASDWASVSVGGEHACATDTAARLWCWGENGSGQLGVGKATTDRSAPVRVGTKADWAAVSAGDAHTCATKTNGTLYCWGSNGSGRVGDGTTTTRRTPVRVGTKADWRNVSAGTAHTCAVKTTGARYCWGSNRSRQLGSGTTTATTPRLVGSGFASAATGHAHSCSLSTASRLACWGSNTSGQVGNGRTATSVPAPTSLGSGSWAAVDGGTAHTCAVGRSGRLSCWGSGASGRLGTGSTAGRTSPTVVGTASTWASVSAGGQHTCAVMTDARLFCWGAGSVGQLGQGDAAARTTPTPVR